MTRSLSKFAQTLADHARNNCGHPQGIPEIFVRLRPASTACKILFTMGPDEVDEVSRIRERLRLVTEQFEREMRDRGFDPQQVENVPLTQSLANLHLEQMQLRSQLAELLGEEELS